MKKFTSFLLIIALALISNTLFAQTFTNYTTDNGLPNNNVRCIDIDYNDNIWIGTDNGIARFSSTDTSYYNTADGLIDYVIKTIYVAKNGVVWAGTDFGLNKFENNVWTSYTTADGIGNNKIKYITEDNDSNIWIGDNDGMTMFTGTNWKVFDTSNGLPFGGVTSIDSDTANNIWVSIGANNGAAKLVDTTTFTFYSTTENLLDNNVYSINVDSNNHKWLGTYSGITVFDENDNWLEDHYSMMPISTGTDTLNPVVDIEFDSKGNVWAGIFVDYLVEGGIAVYDGTDWTSYKVEDGLISNVIKQIAIDSEDNIWIATSNGLSKFDPLGVPPVETCSDGIMNQDEEGIDCGGVCKPCAVSVIETQSSFDVYPTPASDILNIKMSNFDGSKSYSIKICTVSGTQVHESALSSELQSIDISSYEPGIYIIHIMTDDNMTTKKIIKS